MVFLLVGKGVSVLLFQLDMATEFMQAGKGAAGLGLKCAVSI